MRISLLVVLFLLGLIGCGDTSSPRAAQTDVPEVLQLPNITTQSVIPSASLQQDTMVSTPQIIVASTSVTPITATSTPIPEPLIDGDIPPATADDPEWQYHQEGSADFDSDGVIERVVLIARVKLFEGYPVWDDNQSWQVYIEEPDMTRTYVYSMNIQLGMLDLHVAHGQSQQQPTILLVERTPHRIMIHELFYRGPNDVNVTEVFQRQLN